MNARGYPNVLLLIGAAGTGKSTIATTVAGEYQKHGQLGCHLFFLRGRSHPGNVLQSIACSLAVYNKSIADYLVKKLRKSGDIDPSNLKTKFDILIRDTLSAVAANVDSPILIILDALDECGTPETRQSLLNVLKDRLPSLPDNFRILVRAPRRIPRRHRRHPLRHIPHPRLHLHQLLHTPPRPHRLFPIHLPPPDLAFHGAIPFPPLSNLRIRTKQTRRLRQP